MFLPKAMARHLVWRCSDTQIEAQGRKSVLFWCRGGPTHEIHSLTSHEAAASVTDELIMNFDFIIASHLNALYLRMEVHWFV